MENFSVQLQHPLPNGLSKNRLFEIAKNLGYQALSMSPIRTTNEEIKNIEKDDQQVLEYSWGSETFFSKSTWQSYFVLPQ
jgi:hypothetical protein